MKFQLKTTKEAEESCQYNPKKAHCHYMKQLKKLNEKQQNHFVPLNVCSEGVCQ